MEPSDILQLRILRGVSADEVHADGELDVASTVQLDEVLTRSVGEARSIDLDLSGLFFCDVPGVRLLADVAVAAAAAGVAFRVRGVQGDLARLLGLLRVELPIV